jgi:hypothetical protein
LLLLPYVSYLRECIDQQLFEISSLLPPLTPDPTFLSLVYLCALYYLAQSTLLVR